LADFGPGADDPVKASSGFGRDTLAAIESELMAETPPAGGLGTHEPRERRQTLGYERRPEISTMVRQNHGSQSPVGAERAGPKGTKYSTDGAAAQKSARAPAQQEAVEPGCEVFEMVTFVVRGDLGRLSSSEARRDFVAERLIHRLPIKSMAQIDRIDVTPWTVRGTVIVRVWCLVPPA
jgi:hypothetical protein